MQTTRVGVFKNFKEVLVIASSYHLLVLHLLGKLFRTLDDIRDITLHVESGFYKIKIH
jgi:hypothetical protein